MLINKSDVYRRLMLGNIESVFSVNVSFTCSINAMPYTKCNINIYKCNGPSRDTD